MRVTMHGRGSIKTASKKAEIHPSNHILLSRRWRLGDIVMCEPVSRLLSKEGSLTFATRTEYIPLVQSFHETPPATIRYPVMDMKKYNRVINLDVVDLLHKGYTSKVDALLACAGMDPSSLSDEEKRPVIDLPNRYDAWAKSMFSKRGIEGSVICMTRQSWNARSPRNIPVETLDEICRSLVKDHSVVILGSSPVKLRWSNPNLHNLTGSTPDIMSTAGLISNSRLLVSVDTGLMHLCGAMGIPMVTAMGPTLPEDVSSFYPNNTIIHAGREGCCPCFERGCDDPCLRSVSAEMMMGVIEERLSSPSSETRVIGV